MAAGAAAPVLMTPASGLALMTSLLSAPGAPPWMVPNSGTLNLRMPKERVPKKGAPKEWALKEWAPQLGTPEPAPPEQALG